MPDRVAETYYQAPSYSDILHDWLARGRQWHIEYGDYLSNHITHNWVVLGVAGATAEKMQWWEDLYVNAADENPAREPGSLEPPRKFPANHTTITQANWRNNLQTTRVAFPAYRDFFDARLQALGMAATLRQYLPALLPGLAGAALHPVIHTGWACEVGSLNMAGEGLAYMATAFQPLGTGDPHAPPEPLWSPDAPGIIDAMVTFLGQERIAEYSQIAKETSQTDAYRRLNRGGFQHRIIPFDDPGLPLAAALNAVGPLGLPALSAPLTDAVEAATVLIATALQCSDNEFFVLHGLTSLHGVLAMLPYLDPSDRRAALVYWWRAVAATMVAQERPGLQEAIERIAAWRERRKADSCPHRLSTSERSWWTQSVTAALESYDEHIPKAAHVLSRWALWEAFPQATIDVFAAAMRNVIKPHPSGNIHENLWFSNAFSEESAKKERRYD